MRMMYRKASETNSKRADQMFISFVRFECLHNLLTTELRIFIVTTRHSFPTSDVVSCQRLMARAGVLVEQF